MNGMIGRGSGTKTTGTLRRRKNLSRKRGVVIVRARKLKSKRNWRVRRRPGTQRATVYREEMKELTRWKSTRGGNLGRVTRRVVAKALGSISSKSRGTEGADKD